MSENGYAALEELISDTLDDALHDAEMTPPEVLAMVLWDHGYRLVGSPGDILGFEGTTEALAALTVKPERTEAVRGTFDEAECRFRPYPTGHRGIGRECQTHGGGIETAGRDESSRAAVASWEREHRARFEVTRLDATATTRTDEG